MIAPLLLGLTLSWNTAVAVPHEFRTPALHSESIELNAEQAALTVDVEGAPCASCSLTLRRALKKLGGIENIREGSHKKQVIVDFQPKKVSPDAIVAAINRTGLSARAVHLQ